MSEERDRLTKAIRRVVPADEDAQTPAERALVAEADTVLSALEAAEKRIAELERRVAKQDGLIPALKADSKQMNVNAVAYQAERKRAERAEAENAALRTERDAKAKECLEWSERSGHFMRKYDEARAERDRLKEDRQRIIEALGAVHCPECEAVFMVTVPALASGEESRHD